jgi:hypothetical protein
LSKTHSINSPLPSYRLELGPTQVLQLSLCLPILQYIHTSSSRQNVNKEQGFAVNRSDCGNDAVSYRHCQMNLVIRHSNHPRKHAVAHLRYKTEGRVFDTRWCHLNYSGRTKTLGSTQPLTEMSTSYISCEIKAAGA